MADGRAGDKEAGSARRAPAAALWDPRRLMCFWVPLESGERS